MPMAMMVNNSSYGCKLPREIIEEIVLRLDAKSVTRFKCVSKSWLSRISDPSFMSCHHKRQVPRTLLGLQFLDDVLGINEDCGMLCSFRSSENFHEISSKVFPIYKLRRENMAMAFVGSHYGVICWVDKIHNCVYLWNPTIEKHKKLPPSPYTPSEPGSFSPLLTLYGFGYEPLTNDFKVVAACGGKDTETRKCSNFFQTCEQVSLYSLNSNSWKTMVMPDLFSSDQDYDSTMLRIFPINGTASVVVSGSIHWPITIVRPQLRQENLVKVYSDGVVAFDLSSEQFKLINPPSSLNNEVFYVRSIYNLCGCLSLLTSPSYLLSCIEIWVMKKYGVSNSWTKHISLDLVDRSLPSSPRNTFQPLGVLHNGNLLLESRYRGTLAFYDPRSDSGRLQNVCPWEQVFYFATYAESIFLS
ncbi:F-box/kelch-repeat protein At3g23880-like [Humulus lupulus]|uniref:F-box/kelch-repeat protein At3g23880-like n=1 Tax=Humulus lupulus TaxID=3486 RepID=UPI002B41230A|nr:F-box/kelch-repeat protein At3g23880-like [Humulus lupulus]